MNRAVLLIVIWAALVLGPIFWGQLEKRGGEEREKRRKRKGVNYHIMLQRFIKW